MKQALKVIDNFECTQVTGNCLVCNLSRSNPDIDRIVHKVKFDEILTIKEVVERIKSECDCDIGYQTLGIHYRKHLPPSLSMEYGKQAYHKRIRNKFVEKSDLDNLKKVSVKFSAIDKLKEMYVDLGNRLSQFERKHGSEVKVEHLKAYSEIIGELRKIANDVSRITTNRDYIGEVVVSCFCDAFKEVSLDVGKLFKDVVLDSIHDESEKKEILFIVKDRLGKSFEKNLKKFDNDLSKKL
jgi:hypothetical protein